MRQPIRRGSLHVLTDGSPTGDHSHLELALLAADNGADAVQFREKGPWSTARLVDTARRIAEELARRQVALIVNDRADVAFAAGADGVHLGLEDLDPLAARRLLGPAATIGATAHTVAEARQQDRPEIDYIGAGPVFGTSSKATGLPPLGLDGLAAIVRAVSRPVLAIGNVSAERIGELLAAGAHGVAVLGAVAGHADAASRVRRLRQALDRELVAGTRS